MSRAWNNFGHRSKSAREISFKRWMQRMASRAGDRPVYPLKPSRLVRAHWMVLR